MHPCVKSTSRATLSRSIVQFASLSLTILVSVGAAPLGAQGLGWAQRAGGAGVDEGRDIAADNFGNSYVTGRFEGTAVFGAGQTNETSLTSSGDADIFVARYDVRGLLSWAVQAGGPKFDAGFAIATDKSGNCFLTGRFGGTATFGAGDANEQALSAAGSFDMYLAKFDSLGELVWTSRAGGADFDVGESVGLDAAGNVYVTGRFRQSAVFGEGEPNETTLNSTGNFDVFLAKYDGDGTLVWARGAGSGFSDGGEGLAVDALGNSLIAGAFSDSCVFAQGLPDETSLVSAGGEDGFLAKYDSAGSVLWARRLGGESSDAVKRCGLDEQGNGYVVGLFSGSAAFGPGETSETVLTSAGSFDLFLAKYGVSGTLLWARRAGGPAFDSARDIAMDALGNSFVIGEFGNSAVFGEGESEETVIASAGAADIFLAKYDAGGEFEWVARSGGEGSDIGFGVAVDGAENCHIAGSFQGTITMDAVSDSVSLESAGAEDAVVAMFGSSCQPDGGSTGLFSGPVPHGFALSQNYPNPFNPETNISFELPSAWTVGAAVSLQIYDAAGRHVRSLVEGQLRPGAHVFSWNGRTEAGEAVGSGVYLYQLHAGRFMLVKKMLLIR